VETGLLFKELERRRADPAVQVGSRHGRKIDRTAAELKGYTIYVSGH